VRRTFLSDPPPKAETILGPVPVGRSEVRRLWRRKLRTGEEVSATVFLDVSLGECILEITVLAAHASSLIAEGIAKSVLAALEADGAKEPVDEQK
jgi:hypothetical protein